MKPVILPYLGIWPTIHPSAFIAPGACVIGDVVIGEGCSIWYNVVIRGDVNIIRIGARTNIQDGTVVHVSKKDGPTHIGEDVLIGHTAVVHACTLERGSFVGMGSIVMDGAVVGEEAMLAAGAMLTPGKRIESGQMWGGRPAKYMRDLTGEERRRNAAMVARYVEDGRAHRDAIAGLAGPKD